MGPERPVAWQPAQGVAQLRGAEGGPDIGRRAGGGDLAAAVAAPPAQRQNLKIAVTSQTARGGGAPGPTHGKRRAFWDLESGPRGPAWGVLRAPEPRPALRGRGGE